MMASTARRIIRALLLVRPAETRPSLSARDGRFRGDRDLGEVELGPAAGAQRVVDLHDLAAGRALAAQLVGLVAVHQRGDQPHQGQQPGDHEPQEERRALDPADDAAGQAEAEAEDDVGHQMRRSAHSTARITPTTITIVTSAEARPMSTPSISLSASSPPRITTTQAISRLPRLPSAEFSMTGASRPPCRSPAERSRGRLSRCA